MPPGSACAPPSTRPTCRHPAYATTALRIENRAPLIAALSAIFLTGETAGWCSVSCPLTCRARRSTTSPKTLEPPAGAGDADGPRHRRPQWRDAARGGHSAQSVGHAGEPGGAPPLLGEHTDSILKNELRFGDDKIAALRQEGAI